MGIFDSLNVGYSGLSTAQAGINTTSHNISNANTDGYSRQRISQKVNIPLHNLPGDVGSGVHVDTINRIHDEFVYSRLKSSSAKVEHDEFMKDTLTEITTYMPDLQNNGIANDMKNFFNSWSNVALYPNDSSQKVLLADATVSLTKSIKDTKTSLGELQTRLDDRLIVAVDEVNKIGQEIANINKDINSVESTFEANANDLRDTRDSLELRLAKLVDATVFKGKLRSDSSVDRALTDQGTDYNINIAGRNLVDGASFHPLVLDTSGASPTSKFTSVNYMDEDYKKIDITPNLKGGKIGAIIALKGDGIDESGRATNSKIQRYIDDLDSYAKGVIEGVNSVYAQSPQKSLQTKAFEGINETSKITTIDGIKEGNFDLIVYDNSGKEVARRAINIDNDTIMEDPTNINKNSLINQINKNVDDNGDNDGSNDVDDYFKATFGDRKIGIEPLMSGYTIAIEDHGSNFAATSGVHKFFEGNDASDIKLNDKLKADVSKIQSYGSPVDGNNDVANKMVAFQFQDVTFGRENETKTTNTIEGFYRDLTANIASDAAQSVRNHDASTVLNATIVEQQNSVSGVDMDEELIALMKYQTAYQANAKVITAIDKMVDTLLGMK
jgi:flagellar hook-associated protein 1 FlgK